MSTKATRVPKHIIPWPLPAGWAWERMDAVCEVNPPRPQIQRGPNAPTSFLPMSAVDDVEGVVKGFEQRLFSNLPASCTGFIDNDVVFARIDPAMQNGKSAVIRCTVGGVGFGSTEFHVLRPGPRVTPDWVHRFVRLKRFRHQAKKRFRGAIRHQRVPEEFIQEALIPVPPEHGIQETLLARADAALSEVRKATVLLEEMRSSHSRLLDSALWEVFSDNAKSWPNTSPLGELVEVTTARADPTHETNQNFPHIGADVIESGTGTLQQHRTVAEDNVTSSNYLFEANVVLYSKLRPALRKAAVVQFQGLCSADIYPIKPRDGEMLDLNFLLWSLLSDHFTRYADAAARRRASLPKINQNELLGYPLRYPDISQQRQIANYLVKVRGDFKAASDALKQQADAVEEIEQAVFESVFHGTL